MAAAWLVLQWRKRNSRAQTGVEIDGGSSALQNAREPLRDPAMPASDAERGADASQPYVAAE